MTEKKLLANHRKEVLAVVLQFSRNENFRVRAAAYFALNQFLIMHGSSILTNSYSNLQSKEQQQTLINVVLPNVLEAMSAKASPPPRVRKFVMACLINLIGSCISSSALEYNANEVKSNSNIGGNVSNITGNILNAIVSALQEGPTMVQEYCVSAIVSLAETLRGNQFAQYYDALMPVLKQLLHFTHQQGLESFWGSVIECIAIVGESSGKGRFHNDAVEMMNHLVALSMQVDEDSEIRRYILKAWVRIA